MKDMPDEPAAGLTFAKAWKREDPRAVSYTHLDVYKRQIRGFVAANGMK